MTTRVKAAPFKTTQTCCMSLIFASDRLASILYSLPSSAFMPIGAPSARLGWADRQTGLASVLQKSAHALLAFRTLD